MVRSGIKKPKKFVSYVLKSKLQLKKILILVVHQHEILVNKAMATEVDIKIDCQMLLLLVLYRLDIRKAIMTK